MDDLILAVLEALQSKSPIEDIHTAIIEEGWSEDDAFLAIKAGENLYNAIVEQEAELAKRPAPFGRKP